MLNVDLVLLPTIENMVFEKVRSRRYALVSLSFSCFKMVFGLLTKVVAFSIQVTIVKIWIPGFERLIKVIP